jgi:hypothetical protein
MEHRIEIVSARRQSGNRRIGQGSYFANYKGEPIGEFRVPECDAARWLLANGHALPDDRLVMCRNGVPALYGRVGWLADHTVEENDRISPRSARYRAFPSDGPAPLCGSVQDGRDENFDPMANAEAERETIH